MRKKRQDYLVAANDVEFTKGAVTVRGLARRTRASYGAAYQMAAKLKIPVLSRDEQSVMRFRNAIFLIRALDTDGIVTFAAIAKRLKLTPEYVAEFFRARPDLKQAWCVRTCLEARKERLRAAAGRCRAAYPNRPLLRKCLAAEAGMTEKALSCFLARPVNRHMIAELGLEYTQPRPGETQR